MSDRLLVADDTVGNEEVEVIVTVAVPVLVMDPISVVDVAAVEETSGGGFGTC